MILRKRRIMTTMGGDNEGVCVVLGWFGKVVNEGSFGRSMGLSFGLLSDFGSGSFSSFPF